MILSENINLIQKKFPDVLEGIEEIKDGTSGGRFKLEETKSGSSTLVCMDGESSLYIHSKYNPVEEARRLLSKFEDIEKYNHVFFYGVGLGYHIDMFAERFPKIPFSVYEPSSEIMKYYLSHRKLTSKMLDTIFLETKLNNSKLNISKFVNKISGGILLITLPSYERIFEQEYKHFIENFRESITSRKSAIRTDFAFEKRWTLNSMINFKEMLRTPNILHDVDKGAFKGKPALLVSAGPSLAEEIENVRFIKDNNLAYVFSVGSAVNALIQNDIYPDAACTYDPQGTNQKVFETIVKQNIIDIPLIYGSSVGFETVKHYPGPRYHMVTTQDTVTPHYMEVKGLKGIDMVSDAPSIAVVTLELLYKLGCNPIILVGQNLAYRDNEVYVSGTKEEKYITRLTEARDRKVIMVEDVDGHQIQTNESFNRMRKQMELYTSQFNNCEVVNTTKRGARISGTTFTPLSDLITKRLTEEISKTSWKDIKNSSYDMALLIERSKDMNKEYKQLIEVFDSVFKVIEDLKNQINHNNVQKIDRTLSKFFKLLKKFLRNKFFTTFLMPMNRIQYQLLSNSSTAYQFEKNSIVKAQKTVEEFGKFIQGCKKDLDNINPIYEDIRQEVLQIEINTN